MTIEKVLIIDDEPQILAFVEEVLNRMGIDSTCACNGKEALTYINKGEYDLIFTDMKMPGLSGIEIIKKTKELSPHTSVVVMTGFGSIENAVEAMRLGAFHYLVKPLSADIISAMVQKAAELQALLGENEYLRREMHLEGEHHLHRIIAESKAMQQILKEVEQVAKSNASVFISGESGTGKEVIAHAIHYMSPRAKKPFIKVNCAAMPETLIESEFFGHEKGAFTGAANKRIGRFELANEGTLLLDEITEIPPTLQAKLLRVIQEQEFERIGGSKPVKVNVRFVSTTNRVIEEAIEEKIFREDLYYRLNVIPIHIPPLRERREDILPLANYFLTTFCAENHKPLMKLSQDAEKKLLAYGWPGNIRELGNIIERAVVLASGKEIGADELAIGTGGGKVVVAAKGVSLQELEKRHIIETLRDNDNNQKRTAEVLGITSRTLRNKLQEYELRD